MVSEKILIRAQNVLFRSPKKRTEVISVWATACLRLTSTGLASLCFLASIPNAWIMESCVEPGEISGKLSHNPVPIGDALAEVPEEPGLGGDPG
jgi:hypothetical protein